MPAGDPLNLAERAELEETIRAAEHASRVEFSVFVGVAGSDPHAYATRLHNSLVAPARSILIMVDPRARLLEIVTGGWVRRTLDDVQAQEVADRMQVDFAAGDLLGGLRRGIEMLAERAHPPTLSELS